MSINPIEIKGNWDKGYVMDMHIISSVPKGENAYGHMEFDTTRTKLGEMLFLLKNRNRLNCLNDIMDIITPFLDTWDDLKYVDIVMPVPPTNQRSYQPTVEIAQAIADYLNISFIDDVLENIGGEQAKNISKIDRDKISRIAATKKAKKRHIILLVDDLFDTGSTLRECVSVLREDPKLTTIYVLAMTKTKGELQ